MNFARPPKASEQSARPVWADEEWLRKYGGSAANDEVSGSRREDERGGGVR